MTNTENLYGHTVIDFATLAAPDRVQPRERPVRCQDCGAQTWNVGALCDRHHADVGVFANTTLPSPIGGNVPRNNP